MPYREPGSTPMKVVFADDSATMRKVAELTFAGDGYEVSLLSGGSNLVAEVQKFQPSVVVLDTDMPDLDGYEACKKLRQTAETGTVPVLLLSGPSTPYDEGRGQAVGATDHMNKPFETQAFYDKLSTLAATPAAAQPAAAQPAAAPAGVPAPAPAPAPAAAPAAPAPRPTPAKRGGVGSKTVLGLGAMGAAPPKGPVIPGPAVPPGVAPAAVAPAAAAPAPPVAKKPVAPPQPAAAAPPPLSPPAKASARAPQKAPAPSPGSNGATGPLSAEQAEALRTITRDVIEQVVWEIVPDLAETIIKEELAKLLRE